MAATTTPLITLLANRLQSDYPHIVFRQGSDFYWSPQEKTVYYAAESEAAESLLHELAHALLEHDSYMRDIQLLEMERDAWTKARTVLGPKYDTPISEDAAEDALDSYRDWLHARSICPHCKATGIQQQKDIYKCVACGEKWRVNEARICALRRYKITN
ncbi:MAG TPA: hypothetical protein VFZ62_04280 [Candidatus Saccharimonadales bacterium]